MSTARTSQHVIKHPLAGDVIEVREMHSDETTGDLIVIEAMLRVVAVHEERVWFKEYGPKGHSVVTMSAWQKRLTESNGVKVIRGADHDAPF